MIAGTLIVSFDKLMAVYVILCWAGVPALRLIFPVPEDKASIALNRRDMLWLDRPPASTENSSALVEVHRQTLFDNLSASLHANESSQTVEKNRRAASRTPEASGVGKVENVLKRIWKKGRGKGRKFRMWLKEALGLFLNFASSRGTVAQAVAPETAAGQGAVQHAAKTNNEEQQPSNATNDRSAGAHQGPANCGSNHSGCIGHGDKSL